MKYKNLILYLLYEISFKIIFLYSFMIFRKISFLKKMNLILKEFKRHKKDLKN